MVTDTTLTKQTPGVGEQSSVPQAGASLAPHQAALRLLLDDGVRSAHRVHTQNTNIQARLKRTPTL